MEKQRKESEQDTERQKQENIELKEQLKQDREQNKQELGKLKEQNERLLLKFFNLVLSHLNPNTYSIYLPCTTST